MEKASSSTAFSAAFLLPALTCLGYFSSYLFEYGYAQGMLIPTDLVQVTLESGFRFAVGVISFVFLTVAWPLSIVVNCWGLISKRGVKTLLFVGLGTLLAVMSYAYVEFFGWPDRWMDWYLPFVIFIVWLQVVFRTAVLIWPPAAQSTPASSGEPATTGVPDAASSTQDRPTEVQPKAYSWSDALPDILLSLIGWRLPTFLAVSIIVLLFSHGLGVRKARKTYSLPVSSDGYALVATYGDRFILKRIVTKDSKATFMNEVVVADEGLIATKSFKMLHWGREYQFQMLEPFIRPIEKDESKSSVGEPNGVHSDPTHSGKGESAKQDKD